MRPSRVKEKPQSSSKLKSMLRRLLPFRPESLSLHLRQRLPFSNKTEPLLYNSFKKTLVIALAVHCTKGATSLSSAMEIPRHG